MTHQNLDLILLTIVESRFRIEFKRLSTFEKVESNSYTLQAPNVHKY